ncbi:hypothetical protein KQI52_07540 [bacterium]|nr:hypothetical protein [bacterium]
MKRSTQRLIYWPPRILGILFAVFISLFALDVFEEGYNFGELLVAILMHMVPTSLVIIALLVAWRWEWTGAVLFIGLGLAYIVLAWGQVALAAYFGISGPLILTGSLFLVNWFMRRQVKLKKTARVSPV